MQVNISCDDGYNTVLHVSPEMTAQDLYEEVCAQRRNTGHDPSNAEYPTRPTVAFNTNTMSSSLDNLQFLCPQVTLASVAGKGRPIRNPIVAAFKVFGFKSLQRGTVIQDIQSLSQHLATLSSRLTSAIGSFAANDWEQAANVLVDSAPVLDAGTTIGTVTKEIDVSQTESVFPLTNEITTTQSSTGSSSSESIPSPSFDAKSMTGTSVVEAAYKLTTQYVVTINQLFIAALDNKDVKLSATMARRISKAKSKFEVCVIFGLFNFML
jgi:hypothetical protein